MRRQGTTTLRGRSPTGQDANGTSRNANSRIPIFPPTSSHHNNARLRTDLAGGSNRSNSSKHNIANPPIIVTKAIGRRKNTLPYNPNNKIRTVLPAKTNAGPMVTRRNDVLSVNSRSNNSPILINTAVTPNARITTASALPRAHNAVQISNTRTGTSSSVSLYKSKKSRNRVTFDLASSDGKDAVSKVLSSEKILPRILNLMNWNELLPLRSVCKAWYEVIESHPKLKSILGIIIFRPEIESKMATYNSSSVTWTKFRFAGPIIFDMTKSVQNEFWSKHGPLMTFLEVNNRTMTLTGLVEILARCPKLETFKCNWTPEMYSFNSELIKKYYGIHFNNGTFANLQHLTIDYSSSLTDSALWSILKWCGGSIRSLKLASPPDEDILTRLKPRWSVESLKNYFERFGYTGNLQYLDFSWSNLTSDDIRSIASIDMNLRGITLNYCRLDDTALRKLLLKHGETLEVFKIEGTSFTDAIFTKEILPKVKILHIGGVKGVVQSLSFLKEMPHLQELSCHRAQWLEHNMILQPLNSKSKQKLIRALDFGGGIRHNGNKKLDPNLNKNWFSDFTGLIPNIRELNLSQWSPFGTDINFRNICHSLTMLEKLIVRDWEQLSDIGTTGLYEEEIHQDWGSKVPMRPRVFIGLLKRLHVLDLSGTSITDASINLSLYSLRNLRQLAIDGTRVTDSGLRGLINKVPSLDRISILKCSNISLSQPRIKRPDGRMVFIGKL